MSRKKNNFYSNRNIMSFDRNNFPFRFIIGARGIGKTFSTGNLLCNLYHKVKDIPPHPLNVDDLFIYYRLKPKQLEMMGDDILDPKLQKKHNIKVRVIDKRIYFNDRYMGDLLALQDAPNHKGGVWEWSRYKYAIVDEFQLERKERRTFDIIYNLRSSLESVTRFTTRVEEGLDFPIVLFMGNTVDEATDLLYAFDFLPTKYGIYKLKKKNAIIEYVQDGERYRDNQKRNPLRVLNVGDDFTFGERTLKNRDNIIDPQLVGHRRFIAFLHLTEYVRLEVWSTQKGHLYLSRGLPTKKFENRHHVIHRFAANKGTTYNIEFHKLIRKHYAENNIYFDKRITAQIFMKNIV